MGIETYTTIIMHLYEGVFLISIFIGIVGIWNRIRKKTVKYLWVIPCSIFYSIFAICSTFIAYIAYDDPSDPNYRTYENWELHDFILNDIRMLIIWLFIGILLYLVFEGKKCKKLIKKGCAALLIFLLIVLVIIILLSFTKIAL